MRKYQREILNAYKADDIDALAELCIELLCEIARQEGRAEERALHRGKVAERQRRRRVTGSSDGWEVMRAKVLERDDFRCRRCGVGADVDPLVVDHIVPVSRGGQTEYENLQTLCEPCNNGKSDREPHPAEIRQS